MKIRHGFVSNSSSSSFCAQAVRIDKEDFPNANTDFMEELYEELCKKNSGIGLNIIFAYEEKAIYVGLDYEALNDDETGGEFKARAKKLIQRLLKDIEHVENKYQYTSFANHEVQH